MVSGVSKGMGVLDGGGDRRRERGSFGVNLGRSIVTNGSNTHLRFTADGVPRRILNVHLNLHCHWNSNSSRLVTGFTKLTSDHSSLYQTQTDNNSLTIELPTRSS